MAAAYKSIFTGADWIAALNRDLAAPPEPPDIDEAIEDSGPWEATQPAAALRRLRTLPYAMLAWLVMVIVVVVNFLLYRACPLLIAAGYDYTLEDFIFPMILVLGITALEMLIWLILAWRFDRL